MIKIPDHVFRAYDLRGIYRKELTKENVYELGKAYATWLLRRRIYTSVVGYDCRESSPDFHKSIVKSLLDSGISVYDIGISLSPIVYFAQYVYRTPGAVMITASHNPKEYNGFKFGSTFSETLLSDEINELKSIYKSSKYKKLSKPGKLIKENIKDIYIEDVLTRVDKIKHFKVVVDGLHATSGLFMPDIFKKIGCTVIERNIKPDPSFPLGTPDPTEKRLLKLLAEEVIKEKADIGFSYDPDGDRIGVVDERGNVIWNDTLIAIFSKDVLENLPGSKIVFNTLCSKLVDDVIKTSGGKPIMWLTGHSFIAAKIKEERAPFGGELSGHMFFLDNFYGHEDTAIASLRLLAYLTKVGKSLSQVVAELPRYISSPEIKVGCPDKIKFDIVSNKLTPKLKKLYPIAKYVEIDGIRVDTKDEMIIIRASQNGPYLTIKFEAKNDKMYNLLKRQVNTILHDTNEIDFNYGVNLDSIK